MKLGRQYKARASYEGNQKALRIDPGFDSNPGNKHGAEYNSGYVGGYNDGWEDAKNGVLEC